MRFISINRFYLYKFMNNRNNLSVVERLKDKKSDNEYVKIISSQGNYKNNIGDIYRFAESYVVKEINKEKNPQYFI